MNRQDDDDGKMVDLVSQEGDNFQVEKKVAKMSELVKTMIPDDDDEEQQEIPLPNVKSQILGKVMEFCKHYSEEPMNDIEKPFTVKETPTQHLEHAKGAKDKIWKKQAAASPQRSASARRWSCCCMVCREFAVTFVLHFPPFAGVGGLPSFSIE